MGEYLYLLAYLGQNPPLSSLLLEIIPFFLDLSIVFPTKFFPFFQFNSLEETETGGKQRGYKGKVSVTIRCTVCRRGSR